MIDSNERNLSEKIISPLKSLIDGGRLVFQNRKFLEEKRERGEETIVIRFQGEPIVICISSASAQDVLTQEPLLYDAFWKEPFTGLTGPGSLWVLEGQRHRKERKVLNPAFIPRNYRFVGDAIRETTRDRTATWVPGAEISALNEMMQISLEIIMRLVFGMERGDLFERGKRILTALWSNMHPTIVFFLPLQSDWFPIWRRYAEAKAEFSLWVKDVLADRRANQMEADDIIGRMMMSTFEDGSRLSDEDIRDELITILLAGHETTATALAWALYELAQAPDVVAKLRTELQQAGPFEDVMDIVRLPYLTAVCNETMRLHTLLSEVGRIANSPVTVGGTVFPEGTSLLVSIMAIHHDPGIYPEPEAFRPQRFLENTYSPFEFLPFGGGHRRCLGAALSDYEMRIVLAEIISSWEFEVVRKEADIRHDIAMGPRYGVPLTVSCRAG